MIALDGALEEWTRDSTTEVTVVDPERKNLPNPRLRVVERISLRIFTPEGAGEAQLIGPMSWALSRLMLNSWASGLKRGQTGDVEFSVLFGDGHTFSGTVNIRRKSGRDLALHCRKVSSFREAFFPGRPISEALPMFRFFLANYSIPQA